MSGDGGEGFAADSKCRICGSSDVAERVAVREMMFGTGEVFDYTRCGDCGTLQIAEIPDDLARHYAPGAYYSFNNAQREPRAKTWLKRVAARGMVGRPDAFPKGGGPLARIRRGAEPWTAHVPGLTRNSAILDVGCGEGARLAALARLGFDDLTGIDPYLPEASAGMAPEGIRMVSGELQDLDGTFDLITMHHSLEHFADPGAMLDAARRRLRPGGQIFVRIPLMQDGIWQRFGRHWAQIDAPRHLYLFTPEAFVDFAARRGFRTIAQGCDTLGWSLAWSEAYEQGLSMHGENGAPNALPFSPRRIVACEAEARRLNAAGQGDQGWFVLRPA